MRILQFTDRDVIELIHAAAASRITGYAIPSAQMVREREARLERLFADQDEPTPAAHLVFGATNDTGTHLQGGVIIESAPSPELVEADPDRARVFAVRHRTLAAVFVADSAAGQGLGRALLDAASDQALRDGARYLDGFVDDQNNSVGFYRAIGYQVMPHNTGLPARSPANIRLTHVAGVNGHWFYDDLWRRYAGMLRCQRCAGPLTLSPVDDRLACANCGPPPE